MTEQRTILHRRRQDMPPPPVHIPAPERSRRRPWALLLVALVLLFVCGATSLGAGLYIYQQDRILPGVHVLGIGIGGLSVEEAANRLEANWSSREIVLTAENGQTHTTGPSDLGLILDADATARAAYRQGRRLDDAETTIRAVVGRASIQPIWHLDTAAARDELQLIAERVNVAPTDAGIRLSDGQVTATPAQAGRALDVEATLAWLQRNAAQLVTEQQLPVVMTTVQPQVTDVSQAVADLNQRLSNPLQLHSFDPVRGESSQQTVAPDVWAQWVSLAAPAAGGQHPSWHVDDAPIAAFLEAQNAALGDGRHFRVEAATEALSAAIQEQTYEASLRIYYAPRQHVVQNGETLSSIARDVGIPYPWIQHANPGIGDGLQVGQSITIPSPDELLPLPVVENKRIVVSLEQQRMWAYENDNLKWEWPVSTGISSSPTAPGVFQIQSHEPNAYASIWDLWMPQFMGIYRPVPTNDFMNGFHGFPTRNGSNLLWTNSLGRPVTFGCILISNENADLLYNWAEEGVVVEVRS